MIVLLILTGIQRARYHDCKPSRFFSAKGFSSFLLPGLSLGMAKACENKVLVSYSFPL